MDAGTRKHYKDSNAWANTRRRHFGDGVVRPFSSVHVSGRTPLQASRITAPFVDDLLLLGWKEAILLDEENGQAGYERSR